MEANDCDGGNVTGVKADNKNREDSADGACTGGLEENARSVEAGPHNTNCSTEGTDVRVCQDTETVQRWTGLTQEELGKALKERWNEDPEVCFCKDPGKHPRPVSNELPKSQRSVFDT